MPALLPLLLLFTTVLAAQCAAEVAYELPRGYRRLSLSQYAALLREDEKRFDAALPLAQAVLALRSHALPLPLSPRTDSPFNHTTLSHNTEEDPATTRRLARSRFLSLSLSEKERDRASLAPLYPGYGTHFVYLYVGSPPQRQSVIVDTGSHLTAFPCAGCVQCGTHTDAYYEPRNSTTAVVPRCLNDQKCLVSQSYTEGSSWHGYKVQDKLYVGGNTVDILPLASRLSIPFTFACQTSETGLFRTQLADGIMGMSASDDALPAQLASQRALTTRVFALCFRVGGGVLSLGGVDQRLHARRTPLLYAAADTRQNGWFAVRLLGVHLLGSDGSTTSGVHGNTSSAVYPIESDERALNTGKGVIVDSGTTDTYLPLTMAAKFATALRRATNNAVAYSTANVVLSAAQIATLPTIVFTLKAAPREETDRDAAAAANGSNPSNGSPSDLTQDTIELRMPPSSYLDGVGNGKYAFRVYLTEKSGGVLGANAMLSHNVVFDSERQRVGFARSSCNFEEFAPISTLSPSTAPATAPSHGGAAEVVGEECDPEEKVAFTQCSARCDRNATAYTARGRQEFAPSPCAAKESGLSIVSRDCEENCTRTHAVRGDPQCPDTPWSECTHGCVMSRRAVPLTEPLFTHRGECNYRTQTQTCYAGLCPRESGDFMVFIDMRVRVSPKEWSYVHAESFFVALTKLFKLRPNSVELLNNVIGAATSSTKLHLQLRLRQKDFPSVRALHGAAERVADAARAAGFSTSLVKALRAASLVQDKGRLDRFGWMVPADLEVLSAVALPVEDAQRDKHGSGTGDAVRDKAARQSTLRELLLLGVALGAATALCCVLCAHCRLRREAALLAKDKRSAGAQTLQRLWNRLAKRQRESGSDDKDAELATLTREELEEELRLAQSGLLDEEMQQP